MRRLVSLIPLALTLLLAAPSITIAQELAGRVVAAAGEVSIERNAQRSPAPVGTQVAVGDTIHLGRQSNAQIRFSDDSVMALGSETSLNVSEYLFEGAAPENQRVLFNLITGGMRTVTGLIGRLNKSNYRLRTVSATVGIRGTAYAACQACTGIDGTVLPGTTVGFSEGSGVLSTEAGELLLATGESGYAADAVSLPVRIPTFPQTLQQASARPKASQQTAASKEAAPASTSASPAPQSTDSTVAAAPAATVVPVFQATNVPNGAAVIGSSFSGTTFYRLSGPFNLPTTGCNSGPCPTLIAGEFTLAVNFSAQRATASASFLTSTKEIFNVAIPINLGGIPITVNGNQVTFGGTFNRDDFPHNGGSFLCSSCGSNNGPGRLSSFAVSGTVIGDQASLTFTGPQGESVTAPLSRQIPPSNSAAAIATPALTGGDSRSAAYFDVSVDGAGRLLRLGPSVGGVSASVGGAANNITGTAPAAGNLVWGTWTNGTTAATKATITDRDYATFQPNSGSVQPWITGDATNSLPPSLGSLTFNPIGSTLSSQNATLNSARLTADFVNRSLALSINASAAPGAAGTNVYQMNATTGISPTTSRFSAGFNSVTCSGPCNNGIGTPGGSFGGFFSGADAKGAGVAFSTGFGSTGGVGGVANGLHGVIAFGR